MDGAVTREEAAALWRRDLEEAEASSRQTWHRGTTAGMSEFEWLTLITEFLAPVRNELALEFQETRRRYDSGCHDPAGGHGGSGGREEESEEAGVNRVYSVILDTAAACNRWLKEDLGPGLRAGGQDFETPMTLDPPTDIDHWVRERSRPLMAEPADDDDIDGWLHWADLRTAGVLPEETSPREEWSEAVGHGMAVVREALHLLALSKLYLRTGDRAALEANVAVQITENVYRVVAWLAGTLQAWGLALVRVHNAVPEPGDSA